ncbi:hypothetical protein [Prosthecochloris sp. HL-130-GSB]|uniref:DUF2515 family protein n=1 Tax=Prosthecochloris sp. HL-130-GSB TaxID=1974213 RepID=UPI000A1BFEC5|nr:hypothetical protein [Prosthecochloris sp. HL-130-GSB]ARM31893.1 hypothetical protein B9H02_04255 [Prosthecochloris sp. HL-130-GSB]
MIRSKEQWQSMLEKKLPPEDAAVFRNRAITAHYAGLYLAHPELFKWAGMAAFASRQVGLALLAADMLSSPGRFVSPGNTGSSSSELISTLDVVGGALRSILSLPLWAYDSAVRSLLLDDLEAIRKGNNAIYHDISWAHEAYLAGGIEEISSNTGPGKELMLEGFSMIDEGRRCAGSDPDRSSELVIQGNICLLRHEQIMTLGPVFESISPQGRIVVSFGSELVFREAVPRGVRDRASFVEFSGFFETLTGMKSVADQSHRWLWIEGQVLPVWREVDRTFDRSPHLQSFLRKLVEAE